MLAERWTWIKAFVQTYKILYGEKLSRGETFAFLRFLAIFAKLNPREKEWQADSRKFIPRKMCFTKKKAHNFAENDNFKWKSAKSYREYPQFAKVFFHAKRIQLAIRESKSLKFRVFFLSRNFLPAKFSPRKVVVNDEICKLECISHVQYLDLTLDTVKTVFGRFLMALKLCITKW